MAGSKPKAKSAARPRRKRAGLPAPAQIISVDEIKSGNRTLRIIHTTERDEYDPPPARKTP